MTEFYDLLSRTWPDVIGDTGAHPVLDRPLDASGRRSRSPTLTERPSGIGAFMGWLGSWQELGIAGAHHDDSDVVQEPGFRGSCCRPGVQPGTAVRGVLPP